MYRVNRPLVSIVAALAVLGVLLLAQHFLERTPDASLSALPTATAEPVANGQGAANPDSRPAQAGDGLEATMASDAMGTTGGR